MGDHLGTVSGWSDEHTLEPLASVKTVELATEEPILFLVIERDVFALFAPAVKQPTIFFEFFCKFSSFSKSRQKGRLAGVGM